MPVHDWTRVEAGVFHAFHQQWIIAISNALNAGILPEDYYALPEQYAAGFGPDVLTLQGSGEEENDARSVPANGDGGLLVAPPKIGMTAETDLEFYRRKQTLIAVRHVSGDRVVAMVEILSPGNKSTRHRMRSLVEKAAELLDQRIHLLIIDLFPPRHVAVGDLLPEMPLFLEPDGCVQVPLEGSYMTAFVAMPSRWRRVLEARD